MRRAIAALCAAGLLFSACNDGGGNSQPGLWSPGTPLRGDGGAHGNPTGDGSAGDGDSTPAAGDGDQVTGDGDQTTSDSGAGHGGDGDNTPSGDGPTIPAPTMNCPSLASGTQTIMGLETMIVAGTPSPTKKGPLLIYWHGTGSSPQAELLGLLPRSVQDDIVAQGGMVVAPHDPANGPAREGTDVHGGGVWFTTHDFAYADLIAACAVRDYGVDPKRIYTTGCSAGGLMAGVMELSHGSYLAAVSTNSGGLTTKYGMSAGSYVAPVMLMYGDPSKDMVGAGGLSIDFQTTSNNLSDVVHGAGGFVIKCKHDQGHCQAPAALQTAAWQFMKDHPYGTKTSPYASAGLPASFPSYCAIVK